MSEFEKSRTQIFYEWLSKNQIGFTFTIEDVIPIFKISRPSMLMVVDRFASVGVLKHEGGKYRFVKVYTGKFNKAKKKPETPPVVTPPIKATPKTSTDNEMTPLQQLILYVESLEQEVKHLRQLVVSKYTS